MMPSPHEALVRRAIDAVRRHAGAGLLPEAALWLALGEEACTALLSEVGLSAAPGGEPPVWRTPSPFLSPLLEMLWAHRERDGAWTRLAVGTVAGACFGSRHLWQDLGLSGRDEVGALLLRHVPALAAGNTRDLKWKRYLFERLGEELGLPGLRPPRCDGCEDFGACFGTTGTPRVIAIQPPRAS